MPAIPATWVAAGYGTPTVCARHGEPAQPRAKVRFISRPPAWSYILIIIGAVIFLIVVLATRKTVTAPAWPFCEKCRAMRSRLAMIGWSVAGAAVLLFILAIAVAASSSSDAVGGIAALMFLLSFLAILAGGVVVGRSAWPAIAGGQVSGDGVWLQVTRPSPAFAQAGAALQAQAQAAQAVQAAQPPAYQQLPGYPQQQAYPQPQGYYQPPVQPGYGQPGYGYAQPGYGPRQGNGATPSGFGPPPQ
jgi:hypothetical protein